MFKYFHKGFQHLNFFGGTSQKKHPVPKKLKYEKILKYGTGHLKIFLNDTPNYS